MQIDTYSGEDTYYIKEKEIHFHWKKEKVYQCFYAYSTSKYTAQMKLTSTISGNALNALELMQHIEEHDLAHRQTV